MPQRSLKHIIFTFIIALFIFIGGIIIKQIAYAIAVDLLFIFFMLVLIDILTTLEEIRDKQIVNEEEENLNISSNEDKDLENIINSYEKEDEDLAELLKKLK